MGNCHPSKTNVNLGYASVDIAFLGVTISDVSREVNIYIISSGFHSLINRMYRNAISWNVIIYNVHPRSARLV